MGYNLANDTATYRENLGQRLSQVVDLFYTKSDAAAAAGVTAEQFNKWLKGSVKVPAEALFAISLQADIDFNWLATGNGVMNRSAPRSRAAVALQSMLRDYRDARAGQDDPDGLDDLDQPDFIRLPVYNGIRASAGPGAVVPATEQADGVVAFSRPFLRDQGANPERCSIIWARGTSMKPTIPDGSILVVDHSQNAVENGCIYVFNVCDRLLVKRARWRMDGKLELVSDNKDEGYPVETFGPSEADELRVVGRVVYFCRTP